MKVSNQVGNQPKRRAWRIGEKNPKKQFFKDTQSKRVYELLNKNGMKTVANYESEATLSSMKVQLRTLSIERDNGYNRFKLTDNGDYKTFTVLRVK
jgi:hypothetical protein